MTASPAIAVFARNPIPGQAKTRLIPLLGVEGAARVHEALLNDTLHKIGALSGQVSRYLFLTGRNAKSIVVPKAFRVCLQRGKDLGERLECAFSDLLKKHCAVVVVGTDSPMLSPALVRLAWLELKTADAVLGPCPDGGYYLIGLRRQVPGLFRGVRWGSKFAFRDTLGNLLQKGFSCAVLETCDDVDRPQDFVRTGKQLERNFSARRRLPAVWNFYKAWREEEGKSSSAAPTRKSNPGSRYG